MEAEFEEKTVEDAISLAIATLGITRDQFDVEILEDKRGIFGRKARIKVRTVQQVSLSAETDYEHAIMDFIQGLLQRMNIRGGVDIVDRNDKIISINIYSEDASLLIGKDGKTLDSLQRIVHAISRRLAMEKRVLLDVEQYRERKKQKLLRLVAQIITKVKRTGKQYTFSSMAPSERRIIHQAVAEVEQLSTKSVGEADAYYKQVQVFLER